MKAKKDKKKPIIFLKGNKVILRPLRKETDLEHTTRWINDPEVNVFLSFFMPMSHQEESEFFDNLPKRKEDIVFAIDTHDGEFIGLMGIHRINWKDRTATTGAVIGEKKYWGKGYGTDAKMILLDYAFNTLNLRKICSSVIAYNKRSLQYNLHCGYKVEGIRRKQFFRKGKYWDEVELGLFKNEWLPYWKKYQKTKE